MSAHFAIPATTFVLRAILEARLKAAYGTLNPPGVSIEPPPRPASGAGGNGPRETAGLVLYLHHAGPNAAWRNMYEPHVDSSGQPHGRPPLVLNLHYMLAAQGLDLEREAVLGIGMSALHRNGIVPRPMIQALLGLIPVVGPPHTTLMEQLTGEPLHEPANQPEAITVSQQPVDVDLSTKMWSALQSPLRPCAFYLVTTTFLDTGDDPDPVAPVTHVRIAARPRADPAADAAAAAADAIIEYEEPGP